MPYGPSVNVWIVKKNWRQAHAYRRLYKRCDANFFLFDGRRKFFEYIQIHIFPSWFKFIFFLPFWSSHFRSCIFTDRQVEFHLKYGRLSSALESILIFDISLRSKDIFFNCGINWYQRSNVRSYCVPNGLYPIWQFDKRFSLD